MINVIQTIKLNLDHPKQLAIIGKALSVETRVEILKQLRHKKQSINELAEGLNIPPSSAAVHVKVLEEAGLIRTELLPGIRGSKKICHICLDHIYVEVNTASLEEQESEIISMPVGSYVDYKVSESCGLAGPKGPIGEEDEPRSFYSPERFGAKLVWFRKGYVEYRFPNSCLKERKEKQLEISAELCSEDHEYNLECKSEITLWINGIEAGTWCCPSDFGGRRGLLNPDWWPDKNTQYGILKTWKINEKGAFLEDKKTSSIPISQYGLYEKGYISVRIGVKEDAAFQGGVNLFGDGFGDYAQNIVMKLSFE